MNDGKDIVKDAEEKRGILARYRPAFLIFSAGAILLVIYGIKYRTAEYEVSGALRLISYAAILLIISALFMVFVKAKRTILLNLTVLSGLIMLLEITCFFLLGMPAAIKKDFSIPVLPDDHIARNIGTVPYADSVYHAQLIHGSDTVFDVHCSIDQFCKRITPDHDSTRQKFSLFFGCSIAYGFGLEDNQTLPYYFQKISNDCNAYNFGYSGYGTNHMLASLDYHDFSKQVPEKDGSAFYIFFWDHIYRSIGTMSRYCDWLHNAPYYEMKDGSLVRNGMFKDGRYITSKVYESIYQWNTLKKFEVDFPLKLNDSHIDLVAEMIKESEIRYAEKFGNHNFYVVIYPSFKKYTAQEMEKFKSCLDQKNIKYIDISDFIEYTEERTLGGDPHPNAATNEILAEEIVKRIE